MRHLIVVVLMALSESVCADKYGVQEAMTEGVPPTSATAWATLTEGAFFGGLLGYVYCKLHNIGNEPKLAADGCVIVGALVGPFVNVLFSVLTR